MQINEERLLNNLASLAKIGATPDGGVSRPALSEADLAGRDWFRQRAESAGLDIRMDGAGNLSAVMPAKNPDAKTLLFGSHLDSVPNGGRFDGALGVLAAFEALQTLHENDFESPYHLEVISFTDEEGALASLMGSRAAAGLLSDADMDEARDPAALQAGMGRLGLTREGFLNAKRDDIAAFFELHIEQGTRLLDGKLDIGVVTSIVGIRSFWLTFIGEAAHAGTMPMHQRRDAFWGAVDFAAKGRERVMQIFDPGVMNCGMIHMEPGAYNIVPAKVGLALEFRHGDPEKLEAMQNTLLGFAEHIAKQHKLGLNIESTAKVAPAIMDEGIVRAIESACAWLGLSSTRLMSFAGHDTQSMRQIAPSAMFFVPSVDGISHNPAEMTPDADCINGANVILHTCVMLSSNA